MHNVDPLRPPRRVILCGTNTGVGKTHLGVALVRSFRQAGLRVAVLKPIESGVDDFDGIPDDARTLAAAADISDLARVCPWPLPRPVTPAAELERLKLTISSEDLLAAMSHAEADHDLLVIETAGGALSPLTPELSSADLARLSGATTVLVTRNTLGCISHTVSAFEALQSRGATTGAIVLNCVGEAPELIDMNVDWISRACPNTPVVVYRGDATPLLEVLG